MPYTDTCSSKRPTRRDLGGRGLVPTIGALSALAALTPAAASAQSATPGAVVEELVVVAPDNPIIRRFEAAPGGVSIVTAQDMPVTINLTISRALADAPGLVVLEFFGGADQPRIQIRGSGLQQNPVERGVLMLHNGLPLNRADGSYIVGFANPGEAAAVEVYRGYMANRLGATVLGGALNLISPTGRNAPGLRATVGGGSFGQFTGDIRYGVSRDKFDLLLHGDLIGREGYRDHNESRRRSVGANLGLRLSDAVAVRFVASYADLGFEVAGPLTRDLAQRDPTAAFTGPTVTPTGAVNPGPNVVRDQPRRDATQFKTGARASGTFGAHIVDIAAGYARTDDTFRFPMSAGFRVTDGDDVTGVLRYAFRPDAARALPLFEATAQYVTGSADRKNYINLAGRRGALFGRSRLEAGTLALNTGFNIALGEELTLSPSLSWSRATRNNEDRYNLPTRPTAAYSPANPTLALPNGAVPTVSSSYARTYDGWSPALGVTWAPAGGQTLFAALSQSFEPPTHEDLLATVNGAPNSSPGRPNPAAPTLPAAVFATPALKAQRATTIETGWRGEAGPVVWDAGAYYSWVRNELLSLRDASGVSLGAANAPRSRHLGVELGLTARLSPAFTGRVVYTYQDFRFHDDPVRGDNRLAGAPRHWIHGTLNWRPGDRWSAKATLRWAPEKTPIDNLATLYADPYATVDVRGEHRLTDRMSVFAEVTNLFDKTFASSTLIVDQARADQAVYLPGDGRAFGAGLRVKF